MVEGLGRVDRSMHRADRSRSSGIDRGRGPRSCGSVHAPCGRSWIDQVEGLGRAGSIVVEGLGHVDRSWIDPGRAGSIVADRLGRVDRSDRCMDRSWIGPGRAGVDPCTMRIDRGSIPLDRDRSWPTASAVWIDPIGAWMIMDRSRSSGIDPCTMRIDRGSIPARPGSIGADRPWSGCNFTDHFLSD
ncbi:hypothetical protein ACJRO7_010651 [Eucalyptus globulus]|uniref:Uncharacterized protein n=1 Tax=Eucalyptus globulus TaxID=34317 RepID=A0ABD3LCK2_EUCGL